jgi:hypothetical protein
MSTALAAAAAIAGAGLKEKSASTTAKLTAFAYCEKKD